MDSGTDGRSDGQADGRRPELVFFRTPTGHNEFNGVSLISLRLVVTEIQGDTFTTVGRIDSSGQTDRNSIFPSPTGHYQSNEVSLIPL